MTDDPLHRHRCEVRQVLRWRAEHGTEWVLEWLAGVAKKRGKDAAQRLEDDARAQWKLGSRGATGDWR